MWRVLAWAFPALALTGPLLQSGQEARRTLGREWSFHPNGNGIESDQRGVHVWRIGEQPGHKHAFGVARLDFLKGTTEYEIEFRVRFGRPGDIPSRVELWSGSQKPLQVVAGGNKPAIQVAIGGKLVFAEPADDVWRAYRVVGSQDFVKLFLYGKEIAGGPARGLPDILVFGSPDESFGIQGEAWLKVDRVTFRVPQPDDPMLALENLRAEVLELRQRQITDSSGEKWRWIGSLRVTNAGKTSIDLSVMPEIRVVSNDYRESVCFAVKELAGDEAFARLSSGERILAPGEATRVFFAGPLSAVADGPPSSVDFGPIGKAKKLVIPPP